MSEKRRVNAGYDPRLGKVVAAGVAIEDWLESRIGSVAESTYQRDRSIMSRLPAVLKRKAIGAITHAEVNRYILRYPGTAGTKRRIKMRSSSF